MAYRSSALRYAGRILALASLLALILFIEPSAHAAERVHASKNWAGYQVTAGAYAGVSGSWALPASRATSRTLSADAAWVGIGGSGQRDLIQAGTQTLYQDGDPTYQAWYEILPDVQQVIPLAVHPGDTVNVTLQEVAPNLWLLTFQNVTTGTTYQLYIPYMSSHASAEWIVERPLAVTDTSSEYLTLNDFDTLEFTDPRILVNGVWQPMPADAEQILLLDGAGISALPSLNRESEPGFTVTYLTPTQGRHYLRAHYRLYTAQPTQPSRSRMPAPSGR